VRIELGWVAAFDDHAPIGVQAPGLGGAVAAGPLWVGFRLELALPVERADGVAEISLLRLRPTVDLSASLIESAELAFVLGLELGAALWHRTTRVVQSGFVATDAAWSGSFLVAPRAALEVFPSGPRGHWGLSLAAGVDVLPTAPTFAHRVGEETVERASLLPVQPWARVAIVVRAQ